MTRMGRKVPLKNGGDGIAPPFFPIRAIRDIRGNENRFDHEHEQEHDYEEISWSGGL